MELRAQTRRAIALAIAIRRTVKPAHRARGGRWALGKYADTIEANSDNKDSMPVANVAALCVHQQRLIECDAK